MGNEQEPRQRVVFAFDLVEGILLSTVKRTGQPFRFQRHDARVDVIFARTFQELRRRAPDEGLDVSFAAIRPDTFQGHSKALTEVLDTMSLGSDLTVEDVWYHQFKYYVDPEQIDSRLKQLPGRPELYEDLADFFVGCLERNRDQG